MTFIAIIFNLNLSFFIAKRIAFNRQRSFSRFIIRLAVAATALSVAAMIMTLAFVNGFQESISQKVFNFWGHIRVQHYDIGRSMVAEETPIEENDTVYNIIKQNPNVVRVQNFATKSAVLEKNKEIEGVLFKGVDIGHDSMQEKPFMQSGSWISFKDSSYSHDIIISLPMANELNAKVGDTIRIYFISAKDGTSTYRKLKVSGIYKTGIEEYDKLFAIGDIRLIRKLNNWKLNEIGGYEVFLKDYHKMDIVASQLNMGGIWAPKTIKDVYPAIFDWLSIQDVNRNVIFIVMAIVAIINLITCLIVLLLERTRMAGILKAVGADDWSIQQIFLYHASIITLAGVGIGLFAGVGFCILQQKTGFIKLDESAYYLSVAPVDIIWWQVLEACVGTAVVCFLSLIIPTLLIRKIRPVKAIAFR